MKKSSAFIWGLIIGAIVGFSASMFRFGVGSNSGNEYFGSDFAGIGEKEQKGIGNDSGNKYYSDEYIRLTHGNGKSQA